MERGRGSHGLPIDDRMHAALVWLGLAEREESPEEASEHLRSFVRKADAPLFCHLLGCLASDPKRSRAFAAAPGKSSDSQGAGDAIARLDRLLRRGDGGGSKSKGTKPAAHRSGKD